MFLLTHLHIFSLSFSQLPETLTMSSSLNRTYFSNRSYIGCISIGSCSGCIFSLINLVGQLKMHPSFFKVLKEPHNPNLILNCLMHNKSMHRLLKVSHRDWLLLGLNFALVI
ncbi:hypothetical protein L1987_14987 [Smallanthus sonchifolius]|uniref:Uncharacterized protein n=1 Tax=Smallanthus sonchifolius TaxID=185202 RepID=A0ACB9J4U7_9ASTR|nr:hypothetical protein L1987_14987 [Smallanthus sonchifolius]